MDKIDRGRLRSLLTSAAESMSSLGAEVLTARLPAMLPLSLRALAPSMVGHLQIRSTIFDVVTRAADELTEDEWRSLLLLVRTEIDSTMSNDADDEVIRSFKAMALDAARREAVFAIARLRVILSA